MDVSDGAVEVGVAEVVYPALGVDEPVAVIRRIHGDSDPVPLNGSVATGSAVPAASVDGRLNVAPNAPTVETVNVTTKSQLLVNFLDSPTRPNKTPTPQVLSLASTVNLMVPAPVPLVVRS